MDSDAQPTGRVVLTTLARDGPAALECRHSSPLSTLIPAGATRTGPTPERLWPRALEPRAQESLSTLIGALSLRAVRSRHPR